MNSNEVMNAVGFSEVSNDELLMVNGGWGFWTDMHPEDSHRKPPSPLPGDGSGSGSGRPEPPTMHTC